MDGWAVLDRGDPAPGDVAETRALGESLIRRADEIEVQTGRLRGIAANHAALQMVGDYAGPFGQAVAELPGDLSKLGLAYHRCGTALTDFAEKLGEAKSRAGAALRSGLDADGRHRAAVRQVQMLLPTGAGLTAGVGAEVNPMTVEAASVGLDPATRAQIQVAVRQVRHAGDDLAAARNLAGQAAALRDDAEEVCAREIEAALDESGIQDRSWLHRAWKATESAFTWGHFVTACRYTALAAGVAAMVMSGPVGWSLATAALLTGGVVFADGLDKYHHGQIGMGELALDGLALVPAGAGGAAITTLDRLTSTLRATEESGRVLTTFARLGSAGEAAGSGASRAVPTIDEVRAWLPEVNPGFEPAGFRSQNCGECAIAVWRRLRGEPAVAGLHTYSTGQVERLSGAAQVVMSPREIAAELRAKGPGSHAIIGIDRIGWHGHWFNAYYDGDRIVAIDGQAAEIHDWPPNFDLPQAAVVSWDAGVFGR